MGTIHTKIDLSWIDLGSQFTLRKCSHSFRSILVHIWAFTFRSLWTKIDLKFWCFTLDWKLCETCGRTFCFLNKRAQVAYWVHCTQIFKCVRLTFWVKAVHQTETHKRPSFLSDKGSTLRTLDFAFYISILYLFYMLVAYHT